MSHFKNMQVWRGSDQPAQILQGGVVTIGNFDGVHKGHQSLLKRAENHARPRTVVTFDPHPVQVLYPDRALKRLFPRGDLIEVLPKYGVDQLRIIEFNSELAQLSGADFLNEFILKPFAPKAIVAGYDFAVGKSRQGDLEFLESWAQGVGIEVDVVPPLSVSGDVISSRRLRDLVQAGDMALTAKLLGRAFYLRGQVISGAGRGRTIGIPTLNMLAENETLPGQGVYATRTRIDGKWRPSVTNIGTNPTFESGQTVKVETHVLAKMPDETPEALDVEFVERLRGEMKFNGVDELKLQISKDIQNAKTALGKADEKVDRFK